MIYGINYPWTVFDGRANYGCDFGRNKWNSHAGVTVNAASVRDDFAALAAAGIDVVRWFVFTDGRGGLEWNAAGELTGADRLFFADMDAALDIAGERRLRLCLVLLDYLWFDDPQRRLALLNRHGQSAFVDRVLDPFLDRYGRSPAIHSLDLINEPDWIVTELATDRSRAVWPLERLRAFASATSKRIRQRSKTRITIGGGRTGAAREWDHRDYDLDFIQLHSYPDVRYPLREPSLFEHTAADFGVARPLLIGEFPSHPRVHPPNHLSPAYGLEDYLELADRGGYMGAWPWSYTGTDAFGAASLDAIRAWRAGGRRAAPLG